MLAGLLKSDEQDAAEARGEDADALGPPEMAVSFKPQKIAPSFKVRCALLRWNYSPSALLTQVFASPCSGACGSCSWPRSATHGCTRSSRRT